MKHRAILNCRENNATYKANRKGVKPLFLVLLMLFLYSGAKANPVEIGRARQVATTFLNNNGSRSIGLTEISSAAGFSNVYVFTTDNSFVLLSADDCVQPILGYSLTSRFEIENMPANKRAWIQGYSDIIQYAIEHQTRASAEVARQWHDLAEGNLDMGRAITVVAPLIQTQWDQGWPYNNLCPDGTVTGCVATAMAQMMKYWNYPPTGIGMHSYEWNGQTVSADFGSTTYDWDNMLNSYSDNSTEAQQNAVATLMFHCGVSVDMNYGPGWAGGSGAFAESIAGALINYFNYSPETQLIYRANYSSNDWTNMIKAELDQSRPIVYCGSGSGGGHAFVCDGYNNSNYFHFNWGWSGYCDEYYSLDDLSPGPGGIGSGSIGEFNDSQNAVFYAQPGPSCAAEAPILTASLVTEPGVRNAQLNWTEVNNAVSYNIYRNGSLIHTTASGSENSYLDVHIDYGTTTYYVRCIDENGILSWPSNYAPVTITFPGPANLEAEQVEGGVQLTWMPCEGAASYNLYCNNTLISQYLNATSFSDMRPIAGELNYIVKGVDLLGDLSESSNVASVSVPYSTPVVDDLLATVSDQTVNLSWSTPDWCYPQTPSASLTYGDNSFNGYSGFNNTTTYWGHRYPAEDLSAYSNMAVYKVSFYARIPGLYKILIYKGTVNNHPQTQVNEQNVFVETEGWIDIDLAEKVSIDASSDYWVFLCDVEGITSPAVFCMFSENNNGNYMTTDPTSWVMNNQGIAFLIRTHLTDGVYTYNLYRDGSNIANNLSEPTYSDNNLTEGVYSYYVKTNYYGGETEASNQVTIQIGSSNVTITATANPIEGGTVTGAGSYLQGNSCSLTATPNEGYTFANWTENGIQVSDTPIYSFTVTGDRTLIANFSEVQNTITQTSNFSQGYNWWATFIEQDSIDGLTMLQDSLSDNGLAIRSQTSGYTDYYGEDYGWWGSLTSINNESSYRVITSAPCTVAMTGDMAVPSQHPITLSQGWTWIGYVPSTAMDINVALDGLEATLGDRVKSQQGYSEYYGEEYGWFGSLNTIEPGMGLMYYSMNGNPISFTYPDNTRSGELRQNLNAENNHWKPNTFAYPDNMTVMAVVELNEMELKSDNYELAAFANGECRGSVKLTYAEPINRHVAFLTISGKDAAELSFRLYDTETGIEYYDAEERLDFVANAVVGTADDLYTIHFRGTIGMDEFASRVQVYPNPVNAGERFSINVADDVKNPVRVEIINALGVETLRATSVQMPAQLTAPATVGVYTLRITVEGKGTVVRKLVVK